MRLRGLTANVCLLNAEHYQAYLDGDEFEYHGGLQDVSPIVVEVPYDDHWYLVVDGNERVLARCFRSSPAGRAAVRVTLPTNLVAGVGG